MGGLLCRRYESEDGKSTVLQLCLPRDLVPDVLKLLHDLPTSGHLGVNKMTERVRARYYWKGWQEDVQDYCRSCRKCAERNPPPRKARALLETSEVGYPMERVALDVLGPLPMTSRGNRYILVVSDYFTRWPEAYATENHKAPTVASKLVNEWVSRFGVMQHLHSDQGRDFESKIFQTMTEMLGVDKTRTTPYHPESNGLVERINRTLKDMLSKFVNENQDDWDLCLPQVLLAYRTAKHSSTDVTPHRMLFGREARLPVDLIVGDGPGTNHHQSVPEFVQVMKTRFQQAHNFAREKTGVASRRYKDYYDARAAGNPYKVGDRVWRQVPAIKKGLSRKLARPWQGPYIIIKKISDVVYRLQKEGGRRQRVVVHFNSLKHCLAPKEDQSPTKQPTSNRSQGIPRGGYQESRTRPQAPSPRVSDEEEEEWSLVVTRGNRAQRNTSFPPTTMTPLHPAVEEVPQTIPQPLVGFQATERPFRIRKQPVWAADYEMNH